MRVLYFHQHFGTPDSQGGIRSYKMARRLIERGHEVTMVCGTKNGRRSALLPGQFRNGKREGVVDGIYVIEVDLPYSNYLSLARRSWIFLQFALRSTALAMKRDYDLVFASSTPLTAGIPGILASRLRGKPFIFEVRDLWPELPRAMGVVTNPVVLKLMDALEWLSYHSARGCIGLSPGIVEGIKLRGISVNKVAMIPNGCDLDLARLTECKKFNISGIESIHFVAGFTGAHGIANGLDAVLDAASVLLQRGRTDIKLLLVGDGQRKPALLQRSAREGLSNCVFLDPVPKQELFNLMARLDLGLMVLANVPAFYYGTSPNKFFDYLAAGLPVLNNYPGWLADLIREHECGIAVEPDNPGAFADALEYFADHPEPRLQMAHNARRLAETCFDRDMHRDQFVEFLERMSESSEQSYSSSRKKGR